MTKTPNEIVGETLDRIWPPERKADPRKLLIEVETLASEVSDPRAKAELAETKKELRQAERLVDDLRKNPPELFRRDMSEKVLSGRLGEITLRRMRGLPLALSYTAILGAASALIGERAEGVRTNLYVALVAPPGAGKSVAIDWAKKTLGLERPTLMDTLMGSGEGLICETAEAAGNSRLLCVDELTHLFEKIKIERSTLPSILNTGYYHTSFRARMAGQKRAEFNCVLSILGGLVEEKFGDQLGAASMGGLYDRITFGLAPENFRFEFHPFEGPAEITSPVAVKIHPDVWLCKSAWEKESGMSPRVSENAIRIATICAAFDGKPLLTVNDLKSHHEFAKYQHRIRAILRPNPGENFEARLAHKFLDYLGRDRGAFITRRQLFKATRAYDLGPSTADRALGALIFNGDVIEVPLGKTKALRLAFEAEEISAEAAD